MSGCSKHTMSTHQNNINRIAIHINALNTPYPLIKRIIYTENAIHIKLYPFSYKPFSLQIKK